MRTHGIKRSDPGDQNQGSWAAIAPTRSNSGLRKGGVNPSGEDLKKAYGQLVMQYQRLAAKAEADKQFSAAVGALNALRAMVVQPQLDRQFEMHFRGRHSHKA